MRVAMMHSFARSFAGIILCFFASSAFSVGPVVPGQSIWCVTKRIASTIDAIESQVDALGFNVSFAQAFLSSELDVLDSVVDIVESQANVIESKISLLGACQPTPITASTTISLPGYYCLSATNTGGTITVQTGTNNVVVDLSGRRIQSVVIRRNDQVTFRNGTIVGASMTGFGVDVQSGSSNITLEDLDVQNAQVGINMSGVVGASVQNCSLSFSFTGMQLTNSARIVVQETVASSNRNAGFSLLSSTTNLFNDCQALSTGQGNTISAGQNIFGFVANSGYGNVFENCISNGTQGLNIMDFDSIIAGFALRGTEGASKIISCESANAVSNSSGFNVPYGILLEGRFDVPLTLTGVPVLPAPADVLNAVVWSPDARYVAVGGNEGVLAIYEFNRANGVVSRVASSALASSDNIVDIDWHPDGQYLAVVADSYPIDYVNIYSFCSINNTLTLVSTQNRQAGQIRALAWSPSGIFLAVGESLLDMVYAYKFDAASGLLSLQGSGTSLTGRPYEMDWSPDGNYLVISVTNFIEVHSFNQANAAPFTFNVSAETTNQTFFDGSVAWSPDGKYIASGADDSNGTIIAVYLFRPGNLLFQDSELLVASGSNTFVSADWSNDSRYVIAGNVNQIFFYKFNRSTTQLEVVSGTSASTSNVRAVSWSPDGGLVAFGDSSSQLLGFYSALSFPYKNVIKDNTVYCNSGSDPLGIGISGSSIGNMIIQNTAYSNPVRPFMVATNYAFVPNVFNQLFGQGPTLLQNISVGWNEPIILPDDLALLAKQVKYKVFSIESQVDLLYGEATQIQNMINSLSSPCGPTGITAGPITAAGYYCLINDVTGPFAINASNVVLDLNGRKITNGVTISGRDQVRLLNGTIEGTGALDGVSATSSTNILLDTVTIKNSRAGINFANVVGGAIDNCSLTQNTTGLQFTNSARITVDTTIATANTNAGFSLVTSTTNTFIDCKSISTGQGNTNLRNNTVFGFVSSNGYGNIFERCIANGTQALTTTDANSVIAGFALRGTEGSSKIIGCEAANAVTNVGGVTVPYGILLEASINSSLTLTAFPANPVPSASVFGVNWSPSCDYLAVAAFSTPLPLSVYQLNRQQGTLNRVANVSTPGSTTGQCVSWSPDNAYLAVGTGAATVSIYGFDSTTNILSLLTTTTLIGGVSAIDWSYDGNYLATVESVSSNQIRVYSFNRIANSITQVVAISVGGGLLGVGVEWSPNGAYLATAMGNSGSTSGQLGIYSFNRTTNALTLVASDAFTVATRDASWSYDGQYLAVGSSDAGATTGQLRVYRFISSSNTLTLQPSVTFGDGVLTLDWSPDGKYVVAGLVLGAQRVKVFAFDRGARSLTQVATPNIQPAIVVRSVDWSPDGSFIAAGVNNNDINIYTALTFPSKNVITDNTVYFNSGAQYPSGVGISGSSVANMIIQNTAYSNPCPPVGDVGSNYVFATNVFNQLFGQGPSTLQNISLKCNDPIVLPDDLGLLAKQINQQASSIISGVDSVTTKFSTIISRIDAVVPPCGAIPISSGPITAAGYYCLSGNSTSSFAINASNVVLDMNGRKMTNGLTFSGRDQITIMNGAIENESGGVGITASSSTNVEISNVRVTNSATAINFTSVTGALISNCNVSDCLGGIGLTSCTRVVIENTVAEKIQQKGFTLVSSTTCTVRDCKALSIGDGNLLQDTNIFGGIVGFDARGGYGNIFERCIANSTQGLTVTGASSVVAGFRLGAFSSNFEQATKIIDCESSNATTNFNGVTVPYGILLEAQFSTLTSITSINPGDIDSTDQINAVAWSSDGLYLAVGGAVNNPNTNDLFIYSFNWVTQVLTQVDSVNPGDLQQGDSINSLAWSPDGRYLAVNGTIDGLYANDLYVYSFDRTNQKLTQVTSVNPDGGLALDVGAVAWSPDGQYLAFGGGIYGVGTVDLVVYKFDSVAQTLTQIIAISPGSGIDSIASVAWSPNGLYLAVGGAIAGSPGNDLLLYRFDSTTPALVLVDSVNPDGGGVSDTVRSVAWSPNGRYLAVGGQIAGTTGNDLWVYQFNSTTQTLSALVSVGIVTPSTDVVATVAWSPDGTYLAIGGQMNSGLSNALYMYKFDPGARTLTQIASVNPDGGGANDSVSSIVWSPDGQYIAVGGDLVGATGNDFFIYRALTFPSKNVINNNVIYCNSGGSTPNGIGISGSSIANMIIQNTAYSNPISPFMVDTSYAFVANVFNQNFGDQPTLLQNIVMGDRQPIAQPTDLVLLAKQIYYQITQTAGCASTTLTNNNVSSGTISLTTAGNYCLGEPVIADIAISGASVALNLNDSSLTGNIIISADDAYVYNGNVVPPAVSTVGAINAGIDILAAANRTIVRDVVVDASTAPTAVNTGRSAMRIAGNDAQVYNCTLIAGPALNATGSNNGTAGGSGLVLSGSALRTLIRNCTISGNNGANGGTSSTFGNGGNGGHGIEVQSGTVSLVEIDNCLIPQTGLGGAPGTTNGTRTGGRGGDGVSIHASASGVAVHNCIIRNAGLAGLSAAQTLVTFIDLPDPTADISVIDTADGKAVDDLVTLGDNLSIIFGNFADTIKNPIVYNLNNRRATPGTNPANGDGGVLVSNPPDATAGGGNVVVNHIVNVFMDVLSS